MRRLVFLVAFVLVAAPAFAQPHPCDASASGDILAVEVGQTFTVGWCHDGKDTGDRPANLTGFKVYRNNVALTGLNIVTAPGVNTAGLQFSSIARSEPAAGTLQFEVTAVNDKGESARHLFTTLSVLPARTVPTAPVRGRITVP